MELQIKIKIYQKNFEKAGLPSSIDLSKKDIKRLLIQF